MKKLFAFMMMAVLLLGSVQIVTATEPKDKPLIIVLDPGHDLTHGGARSEFADGSALSETKLNMKIAQYCYDELSTYSNVQVYMVRFDNECPFPECKAMDNGAGPDNRKRVDFAANLDADVYVSLHLNSYGSSDVHGASVMVPDKKIGYKKDVAKEGWNLGQSILDELVDLGLKDKGLQPRRSENGTTYENGDPADYYGVIKHARELGIPAIIVEHCFITSPSDVANYLTTEEQLKSLGVADATGIAEYYGLTKDGNTVAPDQLHKVQFYKNGTLVSTEYVRHGDSAMGLDAEYMEITDVTYNKSLGNITGDT
ncbi:MAG: N-acetylmuramoyl-L-alanine amidase, partial [Agathobacter sp.]|nr:N-acetylmuramoyl-L-alanine amidase [Agathobacter sp.]